MNVHYKIYRLDHDYKKVKQVTFVITRRDPDDGGWVNADILCKQLRDSIAFAVQLLERER